MNSKVQECLDNIAILQFWLWPATGDINGNKTWIYDSLTTFLQFSLRKTKHEKNTSS
jgi:hypothetical protein